MNLPHEEQKYKLLPPKEKVFVEETAENSKEFNKNTIQQYNSRIKYRAINAIKEISWLCEKLSENRLKKIFSLDLIPDVLRITEIALKTVTNDLDDDMKDKCKSKIDHLQMSLMPPSELYAYNMLYRSEYARYSKTGGFYEGLLHKMLFLINQPSQKEIMLIEDKLFLAESMLREKGLYNEYENRMNLNI